MILTKQTIITLTIIIVSSAVAHSSTQSHNSKTGIYVKNGRLHYCGNQIEAIGVNYFDLYYKHLVNKNDISFENGIEELSSANIPFARFMASGFWPSEWHLYKNNKNEHFERLDRIISTAEKNNIGLIPSLFWNISTIPNLVGEPLNRLGYTDSKTINFIKTYTSEIVERYKHSPAIWGWEFGNEYNLHTDRPRNNSHRTIVEQKHRISQSNKLENELTAEMVNNSYRIFASTVRKHDKHRIISTGNTIPFPDAYNNSINKPSKKDSSKQFEYVLGRDNPDPVDTISIHLYANNGQGNTKSIDELVNKVSAYSRKINKPLFIGEFGSSQNWGIDKEHAVFSEMIESIKRNNIQLSAIWVYEYSAQDNDWNITFKNRRKFMLEKISQSNKTSEIAKCS